MHGVTGSGKTEVYLRLADAVRKRGRGVLMLVPEIALTPQVAALFRARFGTAVAIQHSGLSDGERHDQWHRIRRGDVDVVIGTRSAVFAPLANPGLIIVDEEHDTSYKQDETPRYHGRDVAIMRGKFANALVVIGSATPTIESYTNALEGRYTLVTMEKRVLDRPMASVTVVNMREEMAEAGDDVVLSRPLVGGDARAARARRTVADPAEPARLRDGGGLPAMHGDARVPELQHLADGAHEPVSPKREARRRTAGLRGVTTATSRSRSRRPARNARRRTWSASASAPSASRPRSGSCFRRRASRASIATRCGGRAVSSRSSRRSPAARSTS